MNKKSILERLPLELNNTNFTIEERNAIEASIRFRKLGLKINDNGKVLLDYNESFDKTLNDFYYGLNIKKNGSNHLIIQGENYLGLKFLEKSKIDVDFIYINPPYFKKTHSEWLNFIARRLKIAKELLAETGFICINLDDSEQAYAKVLADEIFGDDNFIANMPRLAAKGGKNQEKLLKNHHDYVMIYAKNKDKVQFNKKLSDVDNYNYEDERGKYRLETITARRGHNYIELMDFDYTFNDQTFTPLIESGERHRWKWNKLRFEKAKKLDLLVIKDNNLYHKSYKHLTFNKNNNLVEMSKRHAFSSMDLAISTDYTNSKASNELKKIGLTSSKAKPTSLLKYLMNLHPKNNITVLDFFSHSGAIGQATIELNLEDDGCRKFIAINDEDILINRFITNDAVMITEIKNIDKYEGDFEDFDDTKIVLDKLYQKNFNICNHN